MFTQFETVIEIPAQTKGYSFAEMEIQVTLSGDIEGIAVDGSTEWDFEIKTIEALAKKSHLESQYQEIEKGTALHLILTSALDEDPDFQTKAAEELGLALLDAKHAAE